MLDMFVYICLHDIVILVDKCVIYERSRQQTFIYNDNINEQTWIDVYTTTKIIPRVL